MRFLRLTPADARRVPWKNGLGVTEELAIGPPGATFERGDFDWRVSKAAVVADGPFSAFPGFDRVLAVTDGAGLVLDHGGHAPPARVGRLAPYAFSGDWPTSARLVGGRVLDFNVMTRRGRWTADVRVIELGEEPVAAACSLLHVLDGALTARTDTDDATRFAAGDSLLARDLADGATVAVVGASHATAILVRLDAVADR